MRTIVALALVLAFASGAAADKVLTYFTATLADVTSVCFTRDASAANGWRARANATVRASVGSGYTTSVAGPVTSGQRTSIESYVTTHVILALNTQEGL